MDRVSKEAWEYWCYDTSAWVPLILDKPLFNCSKELDLRYSAELVEDYGLPTEAWYSERQSYRWKFYAFLAGKSMSFSVDYLGYRNNFISNYKEANFKVTLVDNMWVVATK
jgi:hypothetical protein